MGDDGAYTDPPTRADISNTIDGYDTPLPLAALGNPYALDAISDTDLHGAGLTSDGDTVVDAAGGVPQSAQNGPAGSLSTYPLETTDLANDTVTAAVIAANAVANQHLKDDAVDTAEIAADAVTRTQILADAIGSAEIAAGAVDEAHLSFDTATQSELDTTSTNLSNHETDTSNPHNVTDNQTGAASALSNHASNSTAHHSKPSSTKSASVSGGYATKADGSGSSSTFEVREFCDGVRVGLQNDESTFVTVTVSSPSGDLTYDDSVYSDTTVEYTFSERWVTEVTVSYESPVYPVTTLEEHVVSLPTHSHDI